MFVRDYFFAFWKILTPRKILKADRSYNFQNISICVHQKTNQAIVFLKNKMNGFIKFYKTCIFCSLIFGSRENGRNFYCTTVIICKKLSRASNASFINFLLFFICSIHSKMFWIFQHFKLIVKKFPTLWWTQSYLWYYSNVLLIFRICPHSPLIGHIIFTPQTYVLFLN